jgi:RimJ/RimL family protein N-acetyltransferase
MRTVETDRLLLHPWRAADGVEMERLFRDPLVRGGRRFAPDRIRAISEDGLQQWRVNGFGPWAAVDKGSGRWIGRLGLDDLGDWPGPDKVEVGFELHVEWWGRGLATEGARTALAFGFEEHGLERIISVTAASNVAARRVMEKAGLVYEGTRHWKSPDVPVVWYAIERAAWRTMTTPAPAPADRR